MAKCVGELEIFLDYALHKFLPYLFTEWLTRLSMNMPTT